jgi:tRNA G18 (ribose-2'-O)-methylase SpoU
MKTLIVILYNIRSTYNVGAIFRTCDGLGINEVIVTGYTPFFDKGLPHEQEKLRKQIHKTALGAEELIKWRRIDDIVDAINYCREQNCQIVALEQGSGSLNLAEPRDYNEDIALILGEEVHGIPPEILAHCDQLLEIPMCGKKESFNVSVAGGIALWELRKATLNDKRMHLRTPE